MNDRDALLLRHGTRQPLDQLLDFGDVLGFGGAVLLGPAIDLAREIIARLAEIAEPDRLRIVLMQRASVSILLVKIVRRARAVWLGSAGSQNTRPSSIDMM